MTRSKEFSPDVALECAVGTFWSQGFDGTSTQDLVDEMKIGKRSLYDTFGNKRDVYLASLKDYIRRAQETERALWDTPLPAAEHIRKLMHTSVVLSLVPTPPGCFAVNASIEQAATNPTTQALVNEYFAARTHHIATVLRLARDDEVSANATSSLIHAAWIGLRAQERAGLSEGAQERLVERIVMLAS